VDHGELPWKRAVLVWIASIRLFKAGAKVFMLAFDSAFDHWHREAG
jgi:hypothetical protein